MASAASVVVVASSERDEAAERRVRRVMMAMRATSMERTMSALRKEYFAMLCGMKKGMPIFDAVCECQVIYGIGKGHTKAMSVLEQYLSLAMTASPGKYPIWHPARMHMQGLVDLPPSNAADGERPSKADRGLVWATSDLRVHLRTTIESVFVLLYQYKCRWSPSRNHRRMAR